eukprot:7388351-Prymnesium_polylepis.1
MEHERAQAPGLDLWRSHAPCGRHHHLPQWLTSMSAPVRFAAAFCATHRAQPPSLASLLETQVSLR